MTTSERAAETARDRLVEAGAVSSRGVGAAEPHGPAGLSGDPVCRTGMRSKMGRPGDVRRCYMPPEGAPWSEDGATGHRIMQQ